ncbi:gp53-like domain-containing protein [Pseudomonas sp. GTC 16482]|uniref:gp53-like domain-containing protein n=1 Tax=Pseudomonas sp. GTC 16482 TaxID=1661693 RepID=UPI0007621509|nr:hypothetical protein [Pseudomonas sp. GTC 16482]
MDRVSAWTTLCTPEGLFRWGSQAGGVPATPLVAGWLNMLQEELVAVVMAYQGSLNPEDSQQLLKSLRAMVANFATKATTLAGYGILDAYTKAQADQLLSQKANNAITLGGYGIGDAYTKTEVNQLLALKAAVATTLAGYGITDAYTSAQVNQLLEQRQLKNTASFGTAASWVRDGSTGAIEQYGVFNMANGANEQTIPFPLAFPTACRSVVLTNFEDAAAENNIVRVLRWTQSGVTILNSGGNTSTAYSWIAKGN